MEDLLIIVAVVLLGLGGVVGVAYSLEVRHSRHGTLGPNLPPPGPTAITLWRSAWVIAGGMVLTLVAALLFKANELAWLTLVGFGVFFAGHLAYHVIRLTGK